jgi:hypothetical protein
VCPPCEFNRAHLYRVGRACPPCEFCCAHLQRVVRACPPCKFSRAHPVKVGTISTLTAGEGGAVVGGALPSGELRSSSREGPSRGSRPWRAARAGGSYLLTAAKARGQGCLN